MLLITSIWVDRREIPYSNSELSIDRQGAVVHRQCEPRVPYATISEVLVGRLGVYGERLRIGVRLNSDV